MDFLAKTDLCTHFDEEMQQTAESGEESSHTQRNMFPKTLTLQLDFDKTLKTPKVTSQDSYFCAKLKTHHLGMYCANDDHIYCFLYDETIGTTGPNEVISLLDYLLIQLENKLGKIDHLIIWCDNAPGQFKECFLFFYLDFIVRRGQFLRADLKFLLEGHTYSVCDRRFGTIQNVFQRQEIIDIPRKWASVLEHEGLSNVIVNWVTLDMIKDYKSFLRFRYVSRNEDLEREKFEVKNIAWLNFGYGEIVDENGDLQLVHHPDNVFVRFQMNSKQVPRKISFLKKKQCMELRPELLTTVREERRAIREDVKRSCIKLAKKYLSQPAIRFYESLPSSTCEENEGS